MLQIPGVIWYPVITVTLMFFLETVLICADERRSESEGGTPHSWPQSITGKEQVVNLFRLVSVVLRWSTSSDQFLCFAVGKLPTFSTVYVCELEMTGDIKINTYQRQLFVMVLCIIYLKSAQITHSVFPWLSVF